MRRTLVVGCLWGVFCGIANGLPIASTLAQMAVPWVWVSALVGWHLAESTRRAALLGGIALLAANIAYFGVGVVATGSLGGSPVVGVRFLVVWAIIGLVVGPVAGVIGHWLTIERMAVVSVMALATVTIAEPLALWLHIDHVDAHIAYAGIALVGLGFPWFRFRNQVRNGVKGTALVLAFTYPTAVILEATLIALGQISQPMRLV